MDKTDRNAQDSGPQDVGERNSGNSVGPENLKFLNSDYAESVTTASSNLLNLGSQAYVTELFPIAAYAVRAPDGVIAWFNSRATELWGRLPVVGDTDERFCGAFKLYRSDGTHMAHCDTPVALALKRGISVHEEEVVIERPDGSRVIVSVHIDPIRDKHGAIVGAVNCFQDINERKQANRATGLLAAIVGSSDDAIISKNLDGVITSWNKSAERLFGYTAEEAIGQRIMLIVPPDRLHEEAMILERLRRGERIDHFETVRVRKDGRTLDISLTISPIRDAAGRVVGASKVARDVTERKRVERATAEQARLLDLSFDAIFVRDSADRITYWNNGARQLYGYTSEEALGCVSHELLRTEFPDSLYRISERLNRDRRWTGELIHKRKDGSQIVVASRWALDQGDQGTANTLLETNSDITQQKESEKSLRESEERFRAIVETTPECVKLVAADGTLLHMNSPGLAMVGADCLERVVGKSIYDLIAPEHRDKFRAFNEKVCRGEKGTLEFDIVGLEGKRRHMETHGAPLRDQGGTLVQLAVTRDITGRHEAERVRREAELSARLLQVQDEERRRIARELHDGVGQLLAAMRMSASRVIREISNLSPDAAQAAEENFSLIDQVSKDIRTMSYLLHPPLLDELGLSSVLRWYIDGFAERSKIAASIELPADFPRLPREHELCLFRIAQECLTNIHRHSGSSTALVRLWYTPSEIKMEVSDAGRGFNQEIQSKIASGESAGVGLRGMQERVKQIGGTLGISSNGKGASVLVVLPLSEEAVSSDGSETHNPEDKYEGSRKENKPLSGRGHAV